MKFEFPDITVQKRQLGKVKTLKSLDAELATIQEECEQLFNYSILSEKITRQPWLSLDAMPR